jgi:hypothetical protein
MRGGLESNQPNMTLPQHTLRLAVGLLIVVIGITAALLRFANHFAVVDRLEDPNCFEMAGSEKSIVKCTQSNPASLCDLVTNPQRYNYKIIRIQAIIVGYHHQHLYEPACNTEGTPTWADYDSPQAADKMMRAIAALKGEGLKRGNIFARVILVGQFEERQPGDSTSWVEDPNFPQIHPIKDRYRFVIMSVEHAEPVAPEVPWRK